MALERGGLWSKIAVQVAALPGGGPHPGRTLGRRGRPVDRAGRRHVARVPPRAPEARERPAPYQAGSGAPRFADLHYPQIEAHTYLIAEGAGACRRRRHDQGPVRRCWATARQTPAAGEAGCARP